MSRASRERAAVALAIAASETKDGETLPTVAALIGLSKESYRLANAARRFAWDALDSSGRDFGDWQYEVSCAEAEAMLRTGWSP